MRRSVRGRGGIGDDGKRVEIRADVIGGLHPPKYRSSGVAWLIMCASYFDAHISKHRGAATERFLQSLCARDITVIIDESRKRGLLIKMIGPGITGNNSPPRRSLHE